LLLEETTVDEPLGGSRTEHEGVDSHA
jgi:hypothetical protein